MRYKFQAHQLAFYDAFHAWNVERQTRAYLDTMRELGAQYDNMWLNRWSRRVGKTSDSLLLGAEASAQYANRTGEGALGMIAIPVQKKIGGVLVPLTRALFKDAPHGYFPEHRSSGGGLHEHLYIPAIESRIVLVGINDHPRALAGTYLDFFVGTEFGFTEAGMADEYTSVIQPQFQRRPWAWSLIESSEPETPDHDFNVKFKPDAQARRAFWSMVITDNTSLTPEEIDDEIRRTGGRNHPTCKRELFNEVAVDPDVMIVPEFAAPKEPELYSEHVVDPQWYPQPKYALAWEGHDPGTTDPQGLVGGYLDWERQQLVIQFAWQEPNASTGRVVAVTQGFERKLWGTEHADAWHRAGGEPLQHIAHAEKTGMGQVWFAPDRSLTYWDDTTETLRPNPFARISDIDNQFIIDLNKDHAMGIRAAEKGPGSADADLQFLRNLFEERHPDTGKPLIVILKNGKTEHLIQQLRSGRWKMRDGIHKVDWERSKLLGHCDCIAALKYMVRDVRWNRKPSPPKHRDMNAPGIFVPDSLKRDSNSVTMSRPGMLAGNPRIKLRNR